MISRIRKLFYSHPLVCLSLLFFASRLWNLTLLPVFIDESTYIDWGWRTVHIPGLFFFPLAFYKMPLVMWLFGLSQYIISDPLLAGRLVGVFFGWLAMLGLFYLARTVTGLRTAFLSSVLYITIPIFLFFDRQALMESALCAAGVWSCLFLYRQLQKPGFINSLLLGISLGLACLIKANGLIFVPAALAIIFYYSWKNIRLRYRLLSYSLLSLFFLLLVMSPVIFQNIFWATIHNVSDFTLTAAELIRFPILTWSKNLLAHLEIIFWYFNPLLLAAVILGRRKIPVVGAWAVLTLVFTTAMVRNGYPRYLVPYLPPLLIFAADWLSRQKIYLFPVFVFPCLFFSFLLITNPPAYFRSLSRLTPHSYITDYLTGRNTGYQAIATVNFLLSHLPPGYVYISVAPNAGNPEQAVFNYLRRRPDTYLGYLDEHLFREDLDKISCLSASVPVYFVSRHDEQAGLNKFLTLTATVTNHYNDDFDNIYTLKNDCSGQTLSLDGLINYYRGVL
jgi:4-amino-4-deoxy-L-arabinose transferase-like glycosyltransferase